METSRRVQPNSLRLGKKCKCSLGGFGRTLSTSRTGTSTEILSALPSSTDTMASYQPAPILKPPPPVATQRTPESRHWRRYRQPTYVKSFAPITHVHFAPSRPHRLAVTAGAEVKLHAPRTNKVVKTVTRFKETARGGEIRKDGNLLVAGDDSGLVQVRLPVCLRPSFRGSRELTSRDSFSAGVQPQLERDPQADSRTRAVRICFVSSAVRLARDSSLILSLMPSGLRTRPHGPLTLLLNFFPPPMTPLSPCTTSRPRRR